MASRLAYRQFHDQTNVAVTASVVLAEFGVVDFDISRPRQELTLHGLLQRGLYQEDRGTLLLYALRHMAANGLKWGLLHEPARTAAIEDMVKREVPDYQFRYFEDLKSPADSAIHLETALSGDARLLLVEARPFVRGVAMHVLLARREGDLCYVMNSHDGQDRAYPLGHVAAHIASPVKMGAVSFAGRQYLYSGIVVRIWKQ